MFRVLLLFLPLWFPPEANSLEIQGEMKVKAHRLVRLQAKGVPEGAALIWDVTPEDAVDVEEVGQRIVFSAASGEYKVRCRAITFREGKTEVASARVVVTIEGGITPSPTPTPKDRLDPVKATGRLRFGSAGCTATVVGPRRTDGRWDVLTASHCTGEVGSRGSISLKDGRSLAVTCVARDRRCDISWLTTDDATQGDLYYAVVSSENPAVGTEVWHQGYGVDRPGNHEAGVITGVENSDGQLRLRISVSSGDSGSGFFRRDNGELVSVVCCGSGLDVWGGSALAARRLRPGVMREELEVNAPWHPIPLPRHWSSMAP